MAVIIESYRSAMLRDQTPNLPWLACAAVFAIVVLASGYHVFKRLESRIADVA
jgi:ABC-type polysaccharide/polyol phosphate export permease